MDGRVTVGMTLAIVALTVLGCGGGAPEVQMAPGEKLSLVYKEMQDLTYRRKNFVTVNVAGFARDFTIEEEFTTSTDSVYTDGTIVWQFTFDKYSEVTYSGGQAIFNEDTERMIVGESLWLKQGRDGDIVDWRGLEGVRSRDSQGQSQRESMVMALAGIFPTLPAGPLGIGDTWTQTVAMPIDGQYATMDFAVTNTYELKGIAMKKGSRCARIGVTTEIMATGKSGDETTDFYFNEIINGEGEGEIFFGIKEGFLISSHEETDVDIETTTRRGREEARTELSSAKGESQVVLVQ